MTGNGFAWIDYFVVESPEYLVQSPAGTRHTDYPGPDETIIAKRTKTSVSGTVLGYFPELGRAHSDDGETARTDVTLPPTYTEWIPS